MFYLTTNGKSGADISDLLDEIFNRETIRNKMTTVTDMELKLNQNATQNGRSSGYGISFDLKN